MAGEKDGNSLGTSGEHRLNGGVRDDVAGLDSVKNAMLSDSFL